MYILAFVIALLASFLLTPYIKKLAFAIGAVDKPDKRKVHTHIMPRLGGLAIFLINIVGSGFGIMIPLNIISAVMAGTLGLPGVVLLLILTI